MPVCNRSTGRCLPHTLYSAEKWHHRLLGFLTLGSASEPKALLIRSCTGIHTFTLDQPLGVAFVDKGGKILRLAEHVPPRRILPYVARSKAVLEWPAHPAMSGHLHIGDHLEFTVDAPVPELTSAWSRFFHHIINYCLALFWLGFVVTTVIKWMHNPSLPGLGLFIYNTLLVYLFLTRRPSAAISRKWSDWLAAIATVLISFSLRAAPIEIRWLQTISVIAQTCSLMAIIFALASLGKSFGIVPANRNIKTKGAYRWIRHPLYAAELFFLFSFLLGNPTPANMIKGMLVLVGQVIRAFAEEKLLENDPQYCSYKARVRYRFIPFVV